MYVSNEDDSLVTVIDIAKRKVIDQIKVGVEPEGITVSPDGHWLVSATETTNMVHWIDTKTHQIVENFEFFLKFFSIFQYFHKNFFI